MSVSKQPPFKTSKRLVFKATSWSFVDEIGKTIKTNNTRLKEPDKCIIYISGLSKEGQDVMVKVTDWMPYAHLELPSKWKWTASQVESLKEYLNDNFFKENTLDIVSVKKRTFLQYSEPVKTMFIAFRSHTNLKNFQRFCKNTEFCIYGLPPIPKGSFVLHETNVDPIIKLATVKKLNLAGWLSVPYKKCDKFSICKCETVCKWKEVKACTDVKDIKAYPRYCSFDIECYSVNHNSKLPNAKIDGNVVFQISLIFGRLKGEIFEKVLLTLGNPQDIEGVTVKRFKTERELLLGMVLFIQEKNPDVFIGYNIIKFDWTYLLARAKKLDILDEFLDLTRLLDMKAQIKKNDWSSSAYGQQKFKYPDCVGRINVDVFVEIERNYRLPSKKLDYAASHFLKDNKKDITPRQLFMLFKITRLIIPLLKKKLDDEALHKIKQKMLDILVINRCSGEVLSYREDIEKAKPLDIPDLVRKAMWLTGVYCIHDSLLPIRLVESLNLWDSMEALANVTKVPLTYLHTRGQGIKVMAQLMRQTFPNIVIPTRDSTNENYQGARVLRAVPGMYEFTVTNDFASLYPSIIIMFNICYTTCIKDDDPISDSECFVLTWKQHIGCNHDPLKRKVNKKKVLCADRRYRFRKPVVEFEKDGTPYLKYEGIMPKLERNLLKSRKEVRLEMEKIQARLKMNKGGATEKELLDYKGKGWEIVQKGSLSEQELTTCDFCYTVLNATQNAMKIAANSMYGAFGAKAGGYATLYPCAESVTAMGRVIITEAIDYITKTWNDAHVFYGDTDSCMSTFSTIKDAVSLYERGRAISKKTTHYLKCKFLKFLDEQGEVDVNRKYIVEGKEYLLENINSKEAVFKKLSVEEKTQVFLYESCPISLAFETACRYILLLTKKKYVCVPIDEKGNLRPKTSKGNMLVVRKNSAWCKRVYSDALEGIISGKNREDIIHIITQGVIGLLTRSPTYYGKSSTGEALFDERQLSLVTSIKDVITYAKKKKKKDENQANTYVDSRDKVISKPTGPLDPRLVYANTTHVQLALKLLRRGDSVPPNTQLEYLYIKRDIAEHKHDKMEDFQYYCDNKVSNNLKPDLVEYVRQLSNSIEQLLYTRFPPRIKSYYKLETRFEELVKDVKRSLVIKDMSTPRISFKKDYHVGWECYGGIRKQDVTNLTRRHLLSISVRNALERLSKQLIEKSCLCVKSRPRKYQLKSIEAKIEVCRTSKNPKLVKLSQVYKSRIVLGKCRKRKLPEDSAEKVAQYDISLKCIPVRAFRAIDKVKEGDCLVIKDVNHPHNKSICYIKSITEKGDTRYFDLAIGERDEEAEVDTRQILLNVRSDKVKPVVVVNKLMNGFVKTCAVHELVMDELKSIFD